MREATRGWAGTDTRGTVGEVCGGGVKRVRFAGDTAGVESCSHSNRGVAYAEGMTADDLSPRARSRSILQRWGASTSNNIVVGSVEVVPLPDPF